MSQNLQVGADVSQDQVDGPSKFDSSDEHVTVAQIRRHATSGDWAVPVFQRGSVWGASHQQKLVESLAMEIPVGSLILWKPLKPMLGSVRFIDEAAPIEEPWLVIDGQQRVRALLALFGHEGDQDVEPDQDPKKRAYGPWVWARSPHGEFGRKRFFVSRDQLGIPGTPIRTHEVEAGWVPMRLATAIPSEEPPRYCIPDHVPLTLGDFVGNAVDHEASVLFLLERRISVVKLRERAPEASPERRQRFKLPEVLRLFVRLNGVGSTMSADEKDFAPLAAKYPEAAPNELKELYEVVHAPGVPEQSVGNKELAREEQSTRNEWMRRGREKHFGLGMYMRVARIVRSYHLGKQAPGLDPWKDEPFHEFDSDVEPEQHDVARQAGHIVRAVAQTLRELGCDDFARVAEPKRLDPLFALLTRWPGLLEGHSGFVQRLALQLLFEPSRQLAPGADGSVKWKEDSEAEVSLRAGKVWMEHDIQAATDVCFGGARPASTKKALEQAFLESLLAADRMQNRWVDLLYTVQVKRGIVDLPSTDHNRAKGEALRVHRENEPNKGHLVPRSLVVDNSGARVSHASRHEVNSVWNLTYMTAKFNGLDGLNDRMPEIPEGKQSDNLHWHQLGDEGVLRPYRTMWGLVHPAGSPTGPQRVWLGEPDASRSPEAALDLSETFAEFRAARVKSLASAFADLWVKVEVAAPTTPSVAFSKPMMPSVADTLVAGGVKREVALYLDELWCRAPGERTKPGFKRAVAKVPRLDHHLLKLKLRRLAGPAFDTKVVTIRRDLTCKDEREGTFETPAPQLPIDIRPLSRAEIKACFFDLEPGADDLEVPRQPEIS